MNTAAARTIAAGTAERMGRRELADTRRRIVRVIDVDDVDSMDDGALSLASSAANTFNAEAADARLLLAAAEHQLQLLGAVQPDVAEALRECAAYRDARRAELISEHYPLLF